MSTSSYYSYHYVLPSQTYSAGTRTTQTLRDLPKQMLGRLCHLWKFIFSFTLTPTYTGAPTTYGHNNVFTNIEFFDGAYTRFQGGGNILRNKERMQFGKLRIPDTKTGTASASARYYKRVLHVGPPQFVNSPTDWVIACGLLENGELRFTHGALADLQGTVSAATCTVRIVAALIIMDELRIPPAYQFTNQSVNANDVQLPGRALYETLAMQVAATPSGFSSGDIGNVRFDLGTGDIIPSVHRSDLLASFNDDFATGELASVEGDPEGTADVAGKKVDQSSPTALADVDEDLQPILWSPPGTQISKLFLAESSARLRWDGSRTSALLIMGRIMSQPQSVVAAQVGKALGRLNIQPKAVNLKTASKKTYDGPYGEFMPWKVKV